MAALADAVSCCNAAVLRGHAAAGALARATARGPARPSASAAELALVAAAAATGALAAGHVLLEGGLSANVNESLAAALDSQFQPFLSFVDRTWNEVRRSDGLVIRPPIQYHRVCKLLHATHARGGLIPPSDLFR